MDTKTLFGVLLVAGIVGGFSINSYFMNNETIEDNIIDVEVGNEAPNFAITDTEGNSFNLSDFENEKVVVLEFMNVNCGACQTYAPYIKDFYELYGPSGSNEVSLIALDINAGSTDEQCFSYVEDYEASYPLINGNPTSYYGGEIVYTPTFYIIFPDGTYTNLCTSYCENSSTPSNLKYCS